MATFKVANLYVGNKHIAADMRLLGSTDFDAIFVCEAHRWWEELNPLGHIHTGPRNRRKALRETGLVTKRRVESVRLVHLSDDTGKPAGQERHAVVARTTIDGVKTALISVHLPAALGFDVNMAAHQRGLRRVVEVAEHERNAGYTPVIGGDFNDLGRTEARVLASEAFAEIGLRYRNHRLDGLAYDPEVWRFEDREVVDNHGSDHKWLTIDLRPRTAAPEVPEEEPEMKFVSRAQWGARSGASPSSHPIGSTKGVTFHWEGPKMGGFTHARCARLVQSIQRFHQITRGWADIAYNAVVCPHGYVFEGRGAWTKPAANGTSQTNDDWYAVCYLGGQGDGFSEDGKEAFIDARDWLVREGGAGRAVNGHRDHKATACPGDAIYHWLHSRNWGRPRNDTRDWFDMATKRDLQDAVRDTRITVDAGKTKKEWRLETLLAHMENEQDKTQRLLAKVLAREVDLDVAALADAVAAKVNAAVNADAEVVKQAVKDALLEGAEG